MKSVEGDFLDRISVKRQGFEHFERFKLSNFNEVLNVISVKVQDLEVLEQQQLVAYVANLVKGHVQPCDQFRFIQRDVY